MFPFIMFLAYTFVSAVVGAFAWPYVLNTWLVFFAKDPTIVWWQGMLLGAVPALGSTSVPVAAITWILMLFLV